MNTLNSTAFLRTSREFPEEIKALTQEINKSYLEIANAVNGRTIGLFPTTKPAVTGNNYYLNSTKRQQSVRQTWTFTSSTLTITHGLNLSNITYVPLIYGTFMDSSTNIFYPLPYVDVSSANNGVSVKLTSTQIIITAGSGSPPNVSTGLITIEWLQQP